LTVDRVYSPGIPFLLPHKVFPRGIQGAEELKENIRIDTND